MNADSQRVLGRILAETLSDQDCLNVDAAGAYLPPGTAERIATEPYYFTDGFRFDGAWAGQR